MAPDPGYITTMKRKIKTKKPETPPKMYDGEEDKDGEC